ncbi:molybdenum ABC transporter ATP-binding protein [Salinicola rhizosphaerae]|uniref:Molybdenum import ATP-binding protein ModC n=1 Tax=Salinicola rhizosphaerae TaxID=1443141 RepID=A0ABQ3DSV2_9GAMM|nr:molybdenum ABC transporter ATP-binding protein [Salinicola rhizosphaerae]GHB09994.1 molybdenum import ATP-binding protein ModC [Salinicola rhizosphaerae]
MRESAESIASAALDCRLRKQLGDFSLDISLSVPSSGVTALFGQSGSGKTSLLRLIAGLDRPDEGHVRLGSRTLTDRAKRLHVPIHRRRLGVVFQEARLFPHYRVRGNLTYGMAPSARRRFDDLVSLLGIESLLDRLPGTLSGGEARRVAIGRALLTEPELLLMDEPLTGLDGDRKQELLNYLVRMTRDIDIPIVYVSHDTAEIAAIADHLALVEKGRLIAHGPLDDLMMRLDLTDRLGGFDAATRLLARLDKHDDHYALSHVVLNDGQRLKVPRIDRPLGAQVRLRIGVRDVALAREMPSGTSYRNGLRASIDAIEPSPQSPSTVEVLLRLGDQRLRARLTREACDEMQLREGQSVIALIRSVAFDAQSR